MKKIKAYKSIAVGLIFSFLLFYCPYFLSAEATKLGNLIGTIYAKDGTTPVAGAIVKLRKIDDGTEYESGKSDIQGAFKIESLKEGLYVAGVSTSSDDFNSRSIIGIRNGETDKVLFSLIPPQEGQEGQKTPPTYIREFPPKNEIRIGKVVQFDGLNYPEPLWIS